MPHHDNIQDVENGNVGNIEQYANTVGYSDW